MKIISQAPCRISLAGSGTDVNPFATRYGGRVLNLTIDLYHQVSLTPRSDKKITLTALGESRNLSLSQLPLDYGTDPKFDLLRAIINHFCLKIPSGFSLTIQSPRANPLGLGRSGSVAVAVIAVFNHWLKGKMGREEMALLASRVEVKELDWPGGKQDPLAAAFGGINLMSFGPGDKVKVTAIKLTKKNLKDLQDHSLMVFLPGERHSGEQQQRLIAGMSDQAKLQALFQLKKSVNRACQLLQVGAWPSLGKLLDQAWQAKKQSNPGVTTPKIDKLYQLARRQGAYAGKLAGAGGSGNFFFLVPPTKKPAVVKALIQAGAQPVKFKFEWQGLTLKTYDN